MAILSRMIDDLPSDGILGLLNARAAAGLRTGGVLISRFTRFAMPGSYWRMLSERVLFLLMLAGIALILLSFAAGPVAGNLGWALFALGLVLWMALYAVGRWLRGRASLPQIGRWLLIGIALALMGVGAVTVAKQLFG